MERFGKRTEILNDLLHINRDCSHYIRDYISSFTDKPVAAGVLHQLDGFCRDCMTELHLRVDPTYGDPADAVDLKGIIYLTWVNRDEVSLARKTPEFFHTCEQKAKNIKQAYEQALGNGEGLTEEIRFLLNRHLDRVSRTVEYITSCKDKNFPVMA